MTNNQIDNPIGKFDQLAKTDEFYLFPDREDKNSVYVSPITDATSYFVVENGELCTCDLTSNCEHVKAVRTAHRDEDREWTEEAYEEVSRREQRVLFMEIEDAIERLREAALN